MSQSYILNINLQDYTAISYLATAVLKDVVEEPSFLTLSLHNFEPVSHKIVEYNPKVINLDSSNFKVKNALIDLDKLRFKKAIKKIEEPPVNKKSQSTNFESFINMFQKWVSKVDAFLVDPKNKSNLQKTKQVLSTIFDEQSTIGKFGQLINDTKNQVIKDTKDIIADFQSLSKPTNFKNNGIVKSIGGFGCLRTVRFQIGSTKRLRFDQKIYSKQKIGKLEYYVPVPGPESGFEFFYFLGKELEPVDLYTNSFKYDSRFKLHNLWTKQSFLGRRPEYFIPNTSRLISFYENKLKKFQIKPKPVVTANTFKIQKESDNRIGIRSTLYEFGEIIRDLDFQQQHYIAFFSIGKNNYKTRLSIPNAQRIKETDDLYFYYFYLNGFNMKPVVKDTTNLQYGAFQTAIPLFKTKGSNIFNFTVTSDIGLSMWKFVTQNGLGFTNQGVSNNIFSSEIDQPNLEKESVILNLNIVCPQIPRPDINRKTPFKIDDLQVNHFMLDMIQFKSIDAVKFSQRTNSKVDLKIEGLYKRLKWHHNLKLLDLFEES